MTYTYQVTEVHLLKNSSRTVAARTALLDRVPSGATTNGADGLWLRVVLLTVIAVSSSTVTVPIRRRVDSET